MTTPCCDLCHNAKVTGEPSTCRNQDCWGCKHTTEEACALGSLQRDGTPICPPPLEPRPVLPPRDRRFPLITRAGTNIEAPDDAAWGHHAYLYAWHWFKAAGDGSADGVDVLTTSSAEVAWSILVGRHGLHEDDRKYLRCVYATTVEQHLQDRWGVDTQARALQLEHDAHLSAANSMAIWLHEALSYTERLLGLTGAQSFGFGQRLFNIKAHLLYDPRTEKKR